MAQWAHRGSMSSPKIVVAHWNSFFSVQKTNFANFIGAQKSLLKIATKNVTLNEKN